MLNAVGLRSIFTIQFKVIDRKIESLKKRSSFLFNSRWGWGNWDLEQAGGLAVQVGVELVLALLDVWPFDWTGAFILKCRSSTLRVQVHLSVRKDDSNLITFILLQIMYSEN